MDEKETLAKTKLLTLLKEQDKNFQKKNFPKTKRKYHYPDVEEATGSLDIEAMFKSRIQEFHRLEKRTMMDEYRESLSNNHYKRKYSARPQKPFGITQSNQNKQKLLRKSKSCGNLNIIGTVQSPVKTTKILIKPGKDLKNSGKETGKETGQLDALRYNQQEKQTIKRPVTEMKQKSEELIKQLSKVEKRILQLKINECSSKLNIVPSLQQHPISKSERSQSARPNTRQHFSVTSQSTRVSSADSKSNDSNLQRTYRRQSSFDMAKTRENSKKYKPTPPKPDLDQSKLMLVPRERQTSKSNKSEFELEKVSRPSTLKYYMKFVTNSPERVPVS